MDLVYSGYNDQLLTSFVWTALERLYLIFCTTASTWRFWFAILGLHWSFTVVLYALEMTDLGCDTQDRGPATISHDCRPTEKPCVLFGMATLEPSNCQSGRFLIRTFNMSSLKQPRAASAISPPLGSAILPARSARSWEIGLCVIGSMPISHSFFLRRVFQ